MELKVCFASKLIWGLACSQGESGGSLAGSAMSSFILRNLPLSVSLYLSILPVRCLFR